MTLRLTSWFSGLIAGTIFGVGLAVSRMTDPNKVLGFLGVAGEWDPSLGFTMLGAVAVTFVGYRLVLHYGAVFDRPLHLPTRSEVDAKLIGGAIIFGIGWGLAGYCPGPAVTGLGGGSLEAVYVLLAMLAGSQLERLWQSPATSGRDAATEDA